MISYMYGCMNTYIKKNKITPILEERFEYIIPNKIQNQDSKSKLSSPSSRSSEFSVKSINEYIHILIVDDSTVFSKILRHQLESEFCCVDTVTCHEDAYYLLKNNIFIYDLLIVDIFMPNVYGTVLVQQIREEMKNKVPIIMLSSIPEFGNEALSKGANLFFEKGYPINKLKNVIVNLLFNSL